MNVISYYPVISMIDLIISMIDLIVSMTDLIVSMLDLTISLMSLIISMIDLIISMVISGSQNGGRLAPYVWPYFVGIFPYIALT